MNSATNPQRKTGMTMLIIAWSLLFFLLAAAFNGWLDSNTNPNQNPETIQSGNVREVILEANRQHHFVVNGSMNGQPVTFLLDTGATDVAIPMQLGMRLGLPKGPATTVNTANGLATAYTTLLEEVTIGAITLRRVRASLNPGLQDDVVLLGMSALKQLEFSQHGTQLILRQYLSTTP